VERKVNKTRLNDHNKRNAEHEFYVLGLMANYEHCNKHCDAAAKGGEEKQRFFGRSQLNAVFS
jgi:SRSO17 transposase